MSSWEARQWLIQELQQELHRPELPLPKSELLLTVQERQAMVKRLSFPALNAKSRREGRRIVTVESVGLNTTSRIGL
jgi:hypothetical protein